MLIFSIFSSNVSAAVAVFAAAITAAYASLKYFSDKAAKVTEFRKAWIESLRQAVAEFGGSAHTIVGRIAIRTKTDSERRENEVVNPSGLRRLLAVFERPAPIAVPVEKELATELLTHWSTLRLSYNKIVLHLNPAEHLAYSLAETAIATHTSSTMSESEENVRLEVSQFLSWCIELAQCRAQRIPKNWLHRLLLREKPTSCDIEKCLSSDTLDQAKVEIDKACIDPGSALLLAAFATRQLLHGRYKNVFNNVNKIEQGIRVVDTSAAIVIKGVWENIKKGEPAYRITSNVAIFSSVILMAIILLSLLMSPSSPQAALKLVISCTSKAASPGNVSSNNTNTVTPQVLDCETVPAK
jgi:hypothetical protein